MKKVLITGAYGFLGRHTADAFKRAGYETVGLGHGHWGLNKPADFGIDTWIEADVNQASLALIKGEIACVVHCAGGSSVGHSIAHPFGEFQRTVDSTLHLLEYLRIKHPDAHLIYPSSAAVYGEQDDAPIKEDVVLTPQSPYGFYKKITEDLCNSYAHNFSIPTTVIRFFSIYGAGLEKQLLWDACRKMTAGSTSATFYGSGNETRDWIHVKDAASLITHLAEKSDRYAIYNGGSGSKISVHDLLVQLKIELQVETSIEMGGQVKEGDPLHYWADISKATRTGWKPLVQVESGLREYAEWFLKRKTLVL